MSDADRHLDDVLLRLAGPDARARDDQRAAVRALVDDRDRVLVVQATGWGKSAVYWAATAARRAAGAGCTLVVSPLLALMRDQVSAAERAGLRAATVNSTNVEDWEEIFGLLTADELDVVLVSPERLANPAFAPRLRDLVARTGLVVIDEAHCLSDWGFDFRPDYQRLARTLLSLAPGTPVLATTATANERVTRDVAGQLGDGSRVFRGSLARASLRLQVVPGLGALERYAWVADALERLPGSGIVYVLTVAETERLTRFLTERGVAGAAYSSAVESDARRTIEDRLRANDLKAVVATSALGMGYDKPDLGFCIHVGSPASPVAYYQQVGRAGRAIDDAVAVLLASESDERIWAYFATAGVPDPDLAARVLDALRSDGPMSLAVIETRTGARRGRLEALLKILAVDGAVERSGSTWTATGEPWHFDAPKWSALAAVRKAEADLMRGYAAGAGCLMEFLQRALDDPDPGPCGRCSVCTGALVEPGRHPHAETVAAARASVRGQDVVLEPRKLWPSGLSNRKGRIIGCEAGRALAFADDPGWSEELAALVDAADGPVSDELLSGVVEVMRRWRAVWIGRPVAVVAMPSRHAPLRVRSVAEHVAAVGKLPIVDALSISGPPPPPDVSSGARVRALLSGLSVRTGVALPPGPVLVVDDTYRTGWTMTVAASLLREAGASAVLPLVLHQLP